MAAILVKSLPVDATLESYRKQAALLLKGFKAKNPEAILCIRQHHPRLPGRANTNDRNAVTEQEISKAKVTLADAQAVTARRHGFENWQKLKQHINALGRKGSLVLPFERAVEAIIGGDAARLKSLLRENPGLITARSTRGHQATLLHYVGANGVEGYRQKTPQNAVKIANILLAAGADVDADLDYGDPGRTLYPERIGSTTLGLVATSVHPAVAGVQLELLETLLNAGASINGIPGGWNPLLAALHNGRGDAAEFLAKRGARLDLEGAAGTGQLEAVRRCFRRDNKLTANATPEQMEMGFLWACEYGRMKVVAFLLEKGVAIAAAAHGETGLHWASYGGHLQIVKLLVKHGAPLEIQDRRYGATPLGWALHGWCYPPPEAKNARYHDVVATLVKAGANLSQVEKMDPGQIKKLRGDRSMTAILGRPIGRSA